MPMLADWYKLKKPRKIITDKQNNTNISSTTHKYDAIVVGGGPAGLTAGYFMAKAGLDVLILERGPFPGAKSCGGTSIIAEHVHRLFPNFWDECSCERIVTNMAYWLMTEDSLVSIRYHSIRLAAAPYSRFTVKRTNLYKWLADKAVAAGATLFFDHCVDTVIFDDQQAIGVQLSLPSAAKFLGNIILLADGANALVAEHSGLTPQVSAKNLALYVKETIALPSNLIEDRFNLPQGQGAIVGLIGYPTNGLNGTGSIHTFKDSINLNVGVSIAGFAQSGIYPADLLDRIKKHPLIQPILDGGVTLEYGAMTIPEGGYHAVPQLVYPGVLITGDAASLANGTHGINLAMWSGYYAAQAAAQAKLSRDFSQKKLSLYQTLLDESFVMQDLKANAKAANFQRQIPYAFDLYTRMANEAAYHTAKVYTMPKRARRKFIMRKLLSIQPLPRIVHDAWEGFKVIW